jgi:tetratricopeptide (TPR) repeat protein
MVLLRVDPTNMVAWNNLNADRVGANYSLVSLGRVRAAMAKLDEANVVEPMTAKSAMVAGAYSNNRAEKARLAAELGDIELAKTLNADAEKYASVWLKGIPPGTAERAYWDAFMEVWKEVEIPLMYGDFARVRSAAPRVAARVEQLQSDTEYAKQRKIELLRRVSFFLGIAAEWVNDFTIAEKSFRAVVGYRKQLPVRNVFDRRDSTEELAWHAAALARTGQLDEAHKTIEPALKFARELAPMAKEIPAFRRDMANVLYAAAIASPDQSRVLLAEAHKWFNAVSPELREMRTNAHLGNRIAEAKVR